MDRECPTSLQTLLATERSHGRFTLRDVKYAIDSLGFGVNNALRVEYDDSVDDEFLISAWRHALRESWSDPNGYKRNEINDSFRYIAMFRHSAKLVKMSEDEAANGMTPDRAYQTLEIPQGVDDEMLITIYNMRVSVFIKFEMAQHSCLNRWKTSHHHLTECGRPCGSLLNSNRANGYRLSSTPELIVSQQL